MKRLRPPCNVVVPCALLCAVLTSCDRSAKEPPSTEVVQHTNAALSAAQLPLLPEGVADVHCWTGGVFAKYMNVKFTASPDQVLDYFRRSGAPYYFEFQADEQRHYVITTHFLAAFSDYIVKPSLYELTYKTGIGSQPWFRSVYDIGHGWHYKWHKGAAGCQLYYDLDTQQFYLYWYFS